MIVLYLNSTVYNKNEKWDIIKIKYYFNKKPKVIFNRINTSNPLKKDLESIILFLKDLKRNINTNNINPNRINKIKIYSKYINNYHWRLLFDTWEYINFRGIKNASEWKEIYLLTQDLVNINFQFEKIK